MNYPAQDTQHDTTETGWCQGIQPPTNFLLETADVRIDEESSCIADEGDFMFQGNAALQQDFDDFEEIPEQSLSAEQLTRNWELWLKYESAAIAYCRQRNNCSDHVDDIVSFARIKFVENNRVEHPSACYIRQQCLMAARSLGYYHHKDRKSKYRNNRPTYTPANNDEAQAIALVKSGELGVYDAVEYFNLTNPTLIAYLEAVLDEYYAPQQRAISLDSMLEDCGDAACDTADNYPLPSLVTKASDLVDQPADHILASQMLRTAKKDYMSGISFETQSERLGMSFDDFTSMILADADIVREDMDYEDAWLFGTPEIVSLEQLQVEENAAVEAAEELAATSVVVEPVIPAPVVVPVVEPAIIDFKSYALASPFYLAAIEAKEAGKSIKELAEAAGMTTAAYRGKIKAQENKIRKVVTAGQMCFSFDDPAPVLDAEPVMEVIPEVVHVAEVVPVPETMVADVATETPDMVVAVVPSRMPSITDVVRSILRPVRWISDVMSASVSGMALSGVVDDLVDRLRASVSDRGSGPGLMAAA